MFERFYIDLEGELQKPLPGFEAQSFMAPLSRQDEIHIEHKEPLRSGAVLLLLYEKNDALYIAYIKRPVWDGHHSGQVAFPGGKLEDFDNTLLDAALRETHEEIGISSNDITIIGQLSPLQIYVSNFMLFPFVGIHKGVAEFKPNSNEVSYVIEVSLLDILNCNNKVTCQKYRNGKNYDIPAYKIGEEIIWGATAMITSEFELIVRKIKV